MNKIINKIAFTVILSIWGVNYLNSSINPVLIPFVAQRFVRVIPAKVVLKPVIRKPRPVIIDPVTLHPIIIGAVARHPRFTVNFRLNF